MPHELDVVLRLPAAWRSLPRTLRIVSVTAALLLTAMGIAYYFTVEPSAAVGILWRPMTLDARRPHEQQYGLMNPRREGDRVRYDLVDLRPENVAAIVADPDALDTDGISRGDAALSIDYRYGPTWTWIAYRIPMLRIAGVIEGIIAAAAALLVVTGVITMRRARQT